MKRFEDLDFEDLEAEVMADPVRRERVERKRAKVVAEQVRDALGELRRVRQLTQVELSFPDHAETVAAE